MCRRTRLSHVSWLVFVGLLFAAACSPLPSNEPTPTVEVLPTLPQVASPPIVSVAPTPTAPPVARTTTPAPTVPLATVGPSLAYLQDQNGQQSLVLFAADGVDRRSAPLPTDGFVGSSDGFVNNLKSAVSPDGQWLAFYTGTAGSAAGANSVGPFDLTLNLLRLSDDQAQPITRLLSVDYPNNFTQAAQSVDPQNPSPDALRQAFLSGLYTSSWSPDGRYLAFAGEMDGPSSDVYLYDMETRSITRLTDGPEEIQWLRWSPDGQWILHGSSYYVGQGATTTFHAVNVAGSSVKTYDLGDQETFFLGWASPSEFVVYSGAMGVGNTDVRKVEVGTGRITTRWPDPFQTVALDPEDNLLAASVAEPRPPDIKPGLYLVDLSDGRRKLVADGDSWSVDYRRSQALRFVATDRQQGTIGIEADGSITHLSSTPFFAEPSPDERWLALCANNLFSLPGLEVYTPDGKLTRRVTDQPIDRVLWRPDSLGMFFVAASDSGSSATPAALYYMALPDGEPILVDQTLAPDYYSFAYSLVWLRGQ